MRMQKISFLVSQLSVYLLNAAILISCVPIQEKSPSIMQYQKAMELVDQGTSSLRDHKLELAKGAFLAATDIVPISAAIDGLGCVAFLEQEYEIAEKYFIEAYTSDSGYLSALGNLALLYDITGDQNKALALFSESLNAEPENYRNRNNYAVFLFNQKKLEPAKNELLKALALAKHPIVIGNLKKLEEYE